MPAGDGGAAYAPDRSDVAFSDIIAPVGALVPVLPVGLDVEESAKGAGYAAAHDPSTLEISAIAETVNGKKKTKGPKSSVSVTTLFKYADRFDYFLMLMGTVGAVALGVSMPLLTLLFGNLTDAFGGNQNNPSAITAAVTQVSLQFVWVAIGAATAAYLEVACWMLTGQRQSARIRAKFLRAVLRQDVAFFDTETSTGDLIARMSGDIVLVQEGMGEKVGQYIRLMTTFVGGFIMAFSRGWQLALVMCCVLPLIALCGGVMHTLIARLTGRGQESYAEANAVVEQCIGTIRTVASFAGEERASEKYNLLLTKGFREGVRQGVVTGVGVGATLCVMFSSYSLSMWYGATLVADPHTGYTGGKVISVLFAVIIGGMSLGQAAPNLAAFASACAAAFKIFCVIDRQPPIDVYNLEGETPEVVVGEMEFRNVDFAYPSRPDVRIFNRFSLCIPAGQTLALVGESGSGKSTIVSLIERFYDPTAGVVLLDGRPLPSLQLKWLRHQIGLVSQEPVLFGTTIGGNIGYGKEGATQEEVVGAAKMANIHDFITSLPQGYLTEVGQRGTQLSGGQKQRVAIARAILKNPRILLLDEATSALDAESEHLVQQALERAMVARTTVVVAHRLTTIRKAERIAVLQRGVVVEAGTHSELVGRPGGAYAQLVRLQEMAKEEEGGKGLAESSSFMVRPNKRAETAEMAETDEEEEEVVAERQKSSGLVISASAADLIVNRNPVTLVKKLAKLFSCGGRGRKGDVESGRSSGEKEKDVSVLRLAAVNRPEAVYALLGVAGAAGQGVMFPLFSLFLSSMITVFYRTDAREVRSGADFYAVMFLLLGLWSLASTTLQMSMFAYMGSSLVRRVRGMTFGHVMHQEIAWFDHPSNSSGALCARLSTDAAAVRSMAGDRLAVVVQNLFTITAGLIIAFTADWLLTLVLLAIVPLLGFVGLMQAKSLKGFSANAKLLFEDASSVANDAVSSIRTVAAFGAEDKVVQLYDDKCQMPIAAGMRKGHVSGVGLGFSQFVMFCSYAMAFWYGAQLVAEGHTTFGNVFKVFFAVVLSATGVAQAAGIAPDMSSVQISVNSIFKILDRSSKIDPNAPGKVEKEGVRGKIEFKNVKFRYPTRLDVLVLRDLCLTVEIGQTVALVGESGSGKSTVVSLIERFYDPEGGCVLIDGVNVNEFQLKWLRQQIGLVSQEPVLFNESIRANICYGREGVSETEMVCAAKDANAHNFISALPGGYDTLVGERGVQLSGGQKQRVAIARAIVKNPRILLLDEATSALDTESEKVVQEALDRVMVGRSTIVIAHRLTTIRNADLIAVVQKGEIVEQGKHAELMSIEKGVYASLVKLHQHAK